MTLNRMLLATAFVGVFCAGPLALAQTPPAAETGTAAPEKIAPSDVTPPEKAAAEKAAAPAPADKPADKAAPANTAASTANQAAPAAQPAAQVPVQKPAGMQPPAAPAQQPSETAIPTVPPAAGTTFPSLKTGASEGTPMDVATSPLPPFEESGTPGSHGATAHAGGHHAGPVIENWWSWEHGPDKEHKEPPFGFALINFAVFLFIMSRLFGKSFREFLRTRHYDVQHAIDRAREIHHQAEKHLRQIEDRARGLEGEIAELLSSFRKQAESERQAIVQRAEAEAANLLKDAEAQAQAAIVAAKHQLEQKTALLAVDLAEKLLRSHINDSDQRKLNERYLTDVEAIAKKASPSTVSPVKEST